MTKKYVLWKRYKVGPYQYVDPTYGIQNMYPDVTFTETGIFNLTDNKEMVGYIEGSDADLAEVMAKYQIHEVDTKTETKILTTVNTWYPSKVAEEDYFKIDIKDGFILGDNRLDPIDKEIISVEK